MSMKAGIKCKYMGDLIPHKEDFTCECSYIQSQYCSKVHPFDCPQKLAYIIANKIKISEMCKNCSRISKCLFIGYHTPRGSLCMYKMLPSDPDSFRFKFLCWYMQAFAKDGTKLWWHSSEGIVLNIGLYTFNFLTSLRILGMVKYSDLTGVVATSCILAFWLTPLQKILFSWFMDDLVFKSEERELAKNYVLDKNPHSISLGIKFLLWMLAAVLYGMLLWKV